MNIKPTYLVLGGIVIFAAGAGVGYLVCQKLLNEEYTERMDNDRQELEDYYEEKYRGVDTRHSGGNDIYEDMTDEEIEESKRRFREVVLKEGYTLTTHDPKPTIDELFTERLGGDGSIDIPEVE